MIQRIQTLFLALIVVLSLLLLNGNVFYFLNGSGSVVRLMSQGTIVGSDGVEFARIGNMWPFTALMILIPLLSVITVFLYTKRKIQLMLSVVLIILSAGLLLVSAYYPVSVVLKFKVTLVPGLKLIIPPLILLFSIFAYRGILKDEKLVKSYDWLR
jgi:hypothetical protein